MPTRTRGREVICHDDKTALWGRTQAMRKLIESTHVALGGQADPLDWAFPYLDDDHTRYATELLDSADVLLLGRRTYEGLSAAYQAMASSPFVDRMNSIPKFVASTTLSEASWNATVIPGDVAGFVADLKRQPGGSIVKYGNGPLDQVLMASNLIDEFHLILTPVAAGSGRHLFEEVHGAPHLSLADVRRFESGVLVLIYTPKPTSEAASLRKVSRRLQFFPQGALDVGHGLLGGRVGKAIRQLLGRDVLHPLVQPPQMPLGIANTGNALAEGKHGRAGHRTRAGSDGLLNGRDDVVDVDAQVSRGRRPAWLGVEQHDDAIADLDLDMTDVSFGIEHPGARSLNSSEHRRQEADLRIGVAADHPGVDACVARWNLNLLLG
jgi:dihydrofolate reductase